MYRPLIRAALLCIATVLTWSSPSALAADDGKAAIDEEALARRITEQVMEQLRSGEFLQQEIERGIETFIRKQREAQARARGQQGQARAGSVRRVTTGRDHVRGNPDARISLIEYSDFECPFCKRFHPTAKQVIDVYEGKVNWVYRHFPLGFHNPVAQKEAEAAECAAELGDDEGFWRYADAVYERTRSNGKGMPDDGLVPLAVELGLEESTFRECLDNDRYQARVLDDFDEGQAIGISGTPGNVLLDNRTGRVRVVEGAVPLARLRAEIDALLGEAD